MSTNIKSITSGDSCSKCIINKPESSKITLHYDTMSRSCIEDEWPSLIINAIGDNPLLSDMISLRPLSLAFENHEQIAKLIIETLKQLLTTTQGQYSPQMLWNSLMHI